ncbi:sigma-54-dependent transcriptional regulator [Roseateles saccharophilus]|uniref:Two-component system response regulator PilR (NtrC family) n=1 Tax=Roseateles saccharophilus TaxID=304 RepID=A0A4R3V4S0_ROSSA|nr:sigma-54 dependent transcriptional regulator [Roseateles saccharophilus]MDG0835161.1 sigma-54-dependent Fis family transcriptional regulator [Roseateles saccharophilus]TCU98760.1 two-component system response regulator PilR (NtrC family) [Roseateles saccharophilus]
MTAPRLLVVDDEPDLRTLYELTLLREGYEIDSAGSVAEALEHLKAGSYSAVITDMKLPDGSGLSVLRWLEQAGRPEKALVITAFGSAENAVEALKAGAYDYLTKPVDLRQFRLVVGSALGRVVPEPAPAVEDGATAPATALRLVGESPAIRAVRSLIDKVARSMAPVLVQGESGTGKELVARAIHDHGARASQRFVAVNCGAIPENLLEAEFFGYRKGAFTGANEDRQGFFQAADGGTLFLDEIGDLPLAMQSKLLRVIQERSVRPVGATAETPINVRILSATHKDLSAEVAAGRFRQDLFYRLNVIQIRVPPLRERLEDLGLISARVLARIAQDAGVSPTPRLTAGALQTLSRYGFPGNVRELENLLHRALALAGGEWIAAEDLGLPDALLDEGRSESQFAAIDTPLPVEPVAEGLTLPEQLPGDLARYLDEVERAILLRALEQHRFNRTAAAASLGLSLRQIRYRMARLAISAGDS